MHHRGRRIVALDTETTGLSTSTDRIVEIAAVETEVLPGTLGREFHQLIDPRVPIPEAASAIHGITDQTIRGRNSFDQVVDQFLNFIRESTLVIHNSIFDVSILDAELVRSGRPRLSQCGITIVDSISVMRCLMPLSPKFTLDDLCDAAGVSRAERAQHGALLDARLLALSVKGLAKLFTDWMALPEICQSNLGMFTRQLADIVGPVLNEQSPISDEDVPCSLAEVVTLHRWLPHQEQIIRDRCEYLMPPGGWYCKHFFARQGESEIYSYKTAADALLSAHDLTPYRTRSFNYRVAPKLDAELQAKLRRLDSLLESLLDASSLHSLVAAHLLLKRMKRVCEKQREGLRGRYLSLIARGFQSDLVTVTESARIGTDYKKALATLLPEANLRNFSSLHRRLLSGHRDASLCVPLFGLTET